MCNIQMVFPSRYKVVGKKKKKWSQTLKLSDLVSPYNREKIINSHAFYGQNIVQVRGMVKKLSPGDIDGHKSDTVKFSFEI